MRSIVRFVLVATALAAPASGATFSVGSGAGCTHATLAGAVASAAANGAGLDSIRLSQNQSIAGPVTVSDQSLEIYGTVDCSADTLANRTVSVTSGDGLRMLGGAASTRTLSLASLTVIMTAGRTLSAESRSLVSLENVLLSNGSAVDGGNVLMTGPNVTLILSAGARVYSGDASQDGGGIHCSGGGTVGMLGGAVYQNQADRNGGGLYLDGCTFNGFAGGPDLGDFGGDGIHTNRAEGSGGGVYATGGAEVNLSGDASHPATARDNRAISGAGGGLALTGAGTRGTAVDAQIYENLAETLGGGVDVRGGASFEMDREGAACSDRLECSSLSRNRIFQTVAAGGHGGAIAVTGGGTAEVRQTYLTGNDSDERGSVAYLRDAGSTLRIESSMLFANSPGLGLGYLDVADGAQLVFAYNSTAGHLNSSQQLFSVGAGSNAAVFSNAFGETAGVLVELTGGGTSTGDCNIVSSVGPLPATWTETGDSSPSALFRDAAHGDLGLRSSALAVDYCDDQLAAPTDRDFDDDVRGFDLPSTPNRLGAFDVGADENVPEPAAALLEAAALGALLVSARPWRSR